MEYMDEDKRRELDSQLSGLVISGGWDEASWGMGEEAQASLATITARSRVSTPDPA